MLCRVVESTGTHRLFALDFESYPDALEWRWELLGQEDQPKRSTCVRKHLSSSSNNRILQASIRYPSAGIHE